MKRKKCKICGKKETHYFGFCSYTCWKKCLDKTILDKPNITKKQLFKKFGLEEKAGDE